MAEADRETEQERYLQGAQEQGMKQGLKKGIMQGIMQGIQQEKEVAAINSLKEGLSVQLVAKITGLSIRDIEHLQSEI